jgi:hypothetical protein
MTWVHQRLSTPLDQTGAMTLFQTNPADHLALAKHLTVERKTEEFVTGKGVVVKWERLRRQNHFLDALYNLAKSKSYCFGTTTYLTVATPGFENYLRPRDRFILARP